MAKALGMPSEVLCALRAFAARLLGCDDVSVHVQRLHGGLDADAVVVVRARPGTSDRASGSPGSRSPLAFVAKHLRGPQLREVAIHGGLGRLPLDTLARTRRTS
jgi:hypothetical protein